MRFIIIALMFIGCNLCAEDISPQDQAIIDKATQAHLAQATKAYDAYQAALNDASAKTIKDLEVLKKKATQAGNLQLALAVDNQEKNINLDTIIVGQWKSQAAVDLLGNPNLLLTMTGTHSVDGDLYVINDDQRITTKDTFKCPSDIHVVVMTNKNNIRLAYGCDEMVFGWEDDATQFRIAGGPANGQHKLNAGTIVPNKWHDIELKTTSNGMTVYVDGKQWQALVGDFSGVNDPVSIYTHSGSTLKVKSVIVN